MRCIDNLRRGSIVQDHARYGLVEGMNSASYQVKLRNVVMMKEEMSVSLVST